MACPNYFGVTCVDGTCPVALDEYYIVCDECPYNEGCEDCAFCNELGQCMMEYMEENE